MVGVYFNCLCIGMFLQVDFIVVFVWCDFSMFRVIDYYIKFDLLYNIYLYVGLFFGFIFMVFILSIDVVFNVEGYEYFYFCVKGDGFGFYFFVWILLVYNCNVVIYWENL